MLYSVPDYYTDFCCTADRCEDTCCAGWQIVIDYQSLKKYRKVEGPFGKRLMKSIRWSKGIFRQTGDKRCAFLNENNLCDMYTELGRESLCRTCRLYPRHVEEFEGVREITLSVSCPEVARLLLTHEEPVRFLTFEKDREETYEDFDPFLYSWLVDAREEMLQILQNRTLDIWVRAGLLLDLAHDLQVRINRQELFSCGDVLERYQTPEAELFVRRKIEENRRRLVKQYGRARRAFLRLYQLEVLREEWHQHLLETEEILFGLEGDLRERVKRYGRIHREFEKWVEAEWTNGAEKKEKHPCWQVIMEQLLVYFVYTYFCGAVYDGNAYGKGRMSVISVFLISEMLVARWVKNEQVLDMDDVVEIVYRYSREIEHSDRNLELLD